MKKSILPALLMSGAVLAGCGTNVSGEATVAGSSSPSAGPTVTVPAGLDTGTYPTEPRTIPAATSDVSWVAEGNRMADALIQVNEVDPRMTIGGAALRSFPVLTGIQLNQRVPDATYKAFSDNQMRVGMTTTRGDKLENPSVAVRIGLYRFDNPQNALKAVEAIRQATKAAPSVTVTGAQKVVAGEFKKGTVDSYLAEGEFVVNISGTGPTTEQATTFVNKAYELELPKLRSFSPTPAAQVPTLTSDKYGLLARTLPLGSDEQNPQLVSGYFGLDGLLHRIADITKGGRYRDAGIDLVATANSVVYRTKDDQAATALAKSLAAEDPAVAPIAALPSVTCGNDTDARLYRCYVPVGRYLGTVSDKSEGVAKQKGAAQFAILANAR
ncbi:hypothetical protein [Tsukamurella sp. 1534]|uniref:DUF7373 family lipoprotein n=1 Tax=Tsukamurella sp. 1534 TaxID=1151061 RepID=UPI000319912C|nr:hypothetical protein [Tsukamurella sp. 1534]